MKRILVLAALGAAYYCPAQAIEEPTDLAFKANVAYPLDATTRDKTATYLIGVGMEYFLKKGLLPDGETTISVDWLGKGANGAKGNMFPIMLNQRFYTKQTEGKDFGRSYFFVGAGMVVIDVDNTGTALAGRVGLGSEFGQHIFGEVSYTMSDYAGGARANTLGLAIGYRF